MKPTDSEMKLAKDVIHKYMDQMGTPGSQDHQEIMKGFIAQAIHDAVEAERESCAELLEEPEHRYTHAWVMAATIRQRNNEDGSKCSS